jgi:hypothetical protein
MKTAKLLSLFAFVVITTFACKKDEVLDNPTLLTTGKWKKIAETEAGTDTYTNASACRKDDTFAFATTGVATLDEDATKCNPADAQTETATWAFVGADKKALVLTLGGFELNYSILELTTTTLKWQFTTLVGNKVVVQTFTH